VPRLGTCPHASCLLRGAGSTRRSQDGPAGGPR
jgi:hypothetical protein